MAASITHPLKREITYRLATTTHELPCAYHHERRWSRLVYGRLLKARVFFKKGKEENNFLATTAGG